MPNRVCIIAAMELKTTKKQHSSKPQNAFLRQWATDFVTTRFDAGSKATITARNASRLAGRSTVTVSGATAAGLERCAYTHGKDQNTIQPVSSKSSNYNTGKNGPEQISSHFADIVKATDADANLGVTSDGDKESANKKGALIVRFDRMERNSENRKQGQQVSSAEQTQTRAPASLMATASVATALPAGEAKMGNSDYTGIERRVATDRREFTLRTMWHCLKNPRRSRGRRRSDKHYPLLDVFDGSAMFLAVALIALSLCDAFFTLNILAHGGREVNPIMNYMLNYGTFAFVASKMLLTALAIVVMTAAGNLKIFSLVRVRSVIAVLIGLYAGLIVYELLILSMV